MNNIEKYDLTLEKDRISGEHYKLVEYFLNCKGSKAIEILLSHYSKEFLLQFIKIKRNPIATRRLNTDSYTRNIIDYLFSWSHFEVFLRENDIRGKKLLGDIYYEIAGSIKDIKIIELIELNSIELIYCDE